MTVKNIEQHMNNKAFTLIEILVAVLIIAILAAIAVPQYQFAVDKANFKKYQAMVHSLSSAYDEYYLAHGQATQNFSDLSISLPQDFTSSYTDRYGNCYSNLQMFCCIYQPRTDNVGKIHCGKSDLSVVYSEQYLGSNYAEVDRTKNKRCYALYNNQKANKFCSKFGTNGSGTTLLVTPQGLRYYDKYDIN